MSTRHITTGSRLFKQFTTKAEPAGDRRVRFTITTAAVDRENDTIDPAGIQFANYMLNPVVLWSHDHRSPAIARTVRIDRVGNGFVAEAEFAPAADHPLAEQIYRLVTGGFIKGSSIGFKPIRWAYNETRGGIDFMEVEALEWSICNLPANPQALIAASAAGIETSMVRAWAQDALSVLGPDPDEPIIRFSDDDDDEPITTTRRELTATIRRAVEPLARQMRAVSARQRQMDDEQIVVLAEHPDDLLDIDVRDLPHVIAEGLRDGIGPIVARETRRALAEARGRIPD